MAARAAVVAAATGAWQAKAAAGPGAAAAVATTTTRVRVLTWNICFECVPSTRLSRARTDSQLRPPFQSARAVALLETLVGAGHDVVALQEVTPGVQTVLAEMFAATHWVSPAPPLTAYFTTLLVARRSELATDRRAPAFARRAFSQTTMARDVLSVRVAGATFATVHLESLSTQPTRAAQMREAVRWLEDEPGPVVVMGDFNVDDRTDFPGVPRAARRGARIANDDVRDAFEPAGFVDAWEALHPEARDERGPRSGTTFDSATHRWKGAEPRKPYLRARYDRIMVRRAGSGASIASAAVFGAEPIRGADARGRGALHVSDHWGVEMELDVERGAPQEAAEERAVAAFKRGADAAAAGGQGGRKRVAVDPIVVALDGAEESDSDADVQRAIALSLQS